MPFFKAPSYMEKARTMENKPYGHDIETRTKPASPSTSKPTSNDSSETLVPSTTNDSSSSSAGHKEPLSTVERIKLEREYEKANPKEPLKPAEGIWKSRWMAVPAAILFGFGGG